MTRPVDVLAMTGERRAGSSSGFPLASFLSERWDDDDAIHDALTVPQQDALDVLLLDDADAWEEAIPDDDDSDLPFAFHVAGPPGRVARIQRGDRALTQANGIVKRIEDDALVLGTPGSRVDEITVGYRLPASLDLRALIGRRVRVTLDEHLAEDGVTARTLTIHTAGDRVWLVAFCGTAANATHVVEGKSVRVTMGPREDGPLVVAVEAVRHVVAPRGEARIAVGGRRLAAELVSCERERGDAGRVAYYLVDDALWH
ncbi:MAG TPA: hypothetical protein VIY73_08655 [Polyangiaceae bacterium]